MSRLMHYHPWRAFRNMEGWTLVIRDLAAEGLVGHTDFDSKTVTLCSSLNQVGRRSTIAHEVAHVERGPYPESMEEHEERVVDQLVARRLVPFDRLQEAWRWAMTMDEVADELWVDRETLDARLRHLHPSERTKLKEISDDRQ